MSAHENLERAEHTAHAGTHSSKSIGVTMALLGVLIAFSAAMVGAQRQELVTSMMDQSWAHSSFTAVSTSYRTLMVELERLRANPPAASASAESATSPLKPFLQRYTDYKEEQRLAKTWDDACEPLIDAHYDAAEGYEHAQLVAEFAIIIASVAVLMSSRVAWVVSLVIGAVSLAQSGYTFVHSRADISEHHETMHHAQHAFEQFAEAHSDAKEDEETVNQLDPGGAIRGAAPAAASSHP